MNEGFTFKLTTPTVESIGMKPGIFVPAICS